MHKDIHDLQKQSNTSTEPYANLRLSMKNEPNKSVYKQIKHVECNVHLCEATCPLPPEVYGPAQRPEAPAPRFPTLTEGEQLFKTKANISACIYINNTRLPSHRGETQSFSW